MRDDQRQRVYDAEEQVGRQLGFAAGGARLVEVAGSTLSPPLELRFGTLDAAERYVATAQGSASFAALFPHAARVPVRLRRRAGARAAHYEPPDVIAVHDGDASLRELIVLHELAHHAQHHDLPPDAAHGRAFAGAFRDLVGVVMGPEVALLLTAAFSDHEVAVARLVGRST